jgi:hypothetical protein
MLRNLSNLRGFGIRAMDGIAGEVDDVYFDDRDWVVRHIVVDTDRWSSGKVLISPDVVKPPVWITHVLPASLTVVEVEGSPDIDTRNPVSRQVEDELKSRETEQALALSDSSLRSANAVIGHHVGARDGDIGHIEDLLVDDETWEIWYVIVNTSNWWGGQRVLISPRSIENVSWLEAKVFVDLTRQAVKESPLYDSARNSLILTQS